MNSKISNVVMTLVLMPEGAAQHNANKSAMRQLQNSVSHNSYRPRTSGRITAVGILFLCSLAAVTTHAQSAKQFNYLLLPTPGSTSTPFISTISIDNSTGILASYNNFAIDRGLHYMKIRGTDIEHLPDVGKFPTLGQYWGSNELGVFVGEGWDGKSFIYANDTFYSIPRSGARSINNNNQVAGYYTRAAGEPEIGYIYENGTFRDIAVPGGRYVMTVVKAINSRGDVAGHYWNLGNESDCGVFIYTYDSRLVYIRPTRLVDEDGESVNGNIGCSLSITGLNDAGELVGNLSGSLGNEPFYVYRDTFELLSPKSKLFGSANSNQVLVSGITNYGEIFGTAWGKGWQEIFTGLSWTLPETPWYANMPTMQFSSGPSAKGSVMSPGQILQGDESISSPSGRYTFTYQADGNCVLYRNTDHRALWASDTYKTPEGITIMQADGNLVTYDRFHKAVFSSGTWRYPGSYLEMQDDGNLVIYTPARRPVWATDTVQR